MSASDPSPDVAGPGGARSLYGKPFWWLLFALGLLYVPAVGYMIESDMAWGQAHPAINAMLNATCLVMLIAGWRAIRGGNVALHKRCMLGAVTASSVFLISYGIRFVSSGSHRYPGDGADKAIYLVVLLTHMVLAVVLVPLVAGTLYLALRGRFPSHRRLARITWPVWVYVSISGIIVYVMLFQLAPAWYG